MTGVVGRASARNGHLPRGLLALLPDARLVTRTQAGDAVAFELLYDRHQPRTLSLCRHVLGSQADAEDALQQAFASAYRGLLAGTTPDEFRPWLLAIARNRCVSMLRARRPSTALDDAEPSAVDVTEEVEQRADVQALAADLGRLPEEQRTAIVLAELDGVRHSEIAQILGCEPAKVKALVFQARTHLMHRKQARDTSCAEIREQIASRERGVLRRAQVRDHLQICPGCAEFRAEVRRQRTAFAALLPVVPSAGLKETVLAATIGSGGATGGGGLLAAIAGGGAILKSSSVALTVAAGVAVTGVAVDEVTSGSERPSAAPAAVASRSSAAGPARPGTTFIAGPGAGIRGPTGGSAPSTGTPAIGTGLGSEGAPDNPAAPGAPGYDDSDRGKDKPADRGSGKPDRRPTPSNRGETPPGGGHGRGGTDERGRSDDARERGAGRGNGGGSENGRSPGRGRSGERGTGNGNGNATAYGRGGNPRSDTGGRANDDGAGRSPGGGSQGNAGGNGNGNANGHAGSGPAPGHSGGAPHGVGVGGEPPGHSRKLDTD